jgi:glycosyl hydrolase family 26
MRCGAGSLVDPRAPEERGIDHLVFVTVGERLRSPGDVRAARGSRAAVACAALLVLVGAAAATADANEEARAPAHRPLFGLDLPAGPYDVAAIRRVELRVRAKASIVAFGQDWSDHFHAYLLDRIWRKGALPLVSWEPWSYRAYGPGPGGSAVRQPRYRLATIIAGRHDRLIRKYARAARHWRKPLLLRFAPEMNGDWNSWSEDVNGNRPGEFVRAWRHVHRIFERERVRNVRWVWSPNEVWGEPGTVGTVERLPSFYPGDRYVDVMCIDGYNWGIVRPWSAWRSIEEVFEPTLKVLRSLSRKPVMICETASTERGGDKAAWFAGFHRFVARHRELLGVVWFNHTKETDWRITSSPRGLRAFRAGAGSFSRNASPLVRRLGLKLTPPATRAATPRQRSSRARAPAPVAWPK